MEHKNPIISRSLKFRPIRVNKPQTTNTVHKIPVQSHKQLLQVLFVTSLCSLVLLGLLNIYDLTINASSVATDLAIQTLQNGNGSHFPPWQFKLIIQPHKVHKATSVRLLEDTSLTSAWKVGTETYGKFVNKYNLKIELDVLNINTYAELAIDLTVRSRVQ